MWTSMERGKECFWERYQSRAALADWGCQCVGYNWSIRAMIHRMVLHTEWVCLQLSLKWCESSMFRLSLGVLPF
jgi:hypothetical protein